MQPTVITAAKCRWRPWLWALAMLGGYFIISIFYILPFHEGVLSYAAQLLYILPLWIGVAYAVRGLWRQWRTFASRSEIYQAIAATLLTLLLLLFTLWASALFVKSLTAPAHTFVTDKYHVSLHQSTNRSGNYFKNYFLYVENCPITYRQPPMLRFPINAATAKKLDGTSVPIAITHRGGTLWAYDILDQSDNIFTKCPQ